MLNCPIYIMNVFNVFIAEIDLSIYYGIISLDNRRINCKAFCGLDSMILCVCIYPRCSAVKKSNVLFETASINPASNDSTLFDRNRSIIFYESKYSISVLSNSIS